MIVSLKKDKALGLITLYVELDLIHDTKDNKGAKKIWDTFKTLFGTVNTTQVKQLETELSNLKMDDFDMVEEYIAKFKNLKVDIIQAKGKGRLDLELVSIVLNNLSPTFNYFFLIFYNITLFVKDPVTPTLEEIFSNLIQYQATLRNMDELPSDIKPIQRLSQPLLNLSLIGAKGTTQNPPRKKRS
jgi:hypothetical protein